MYVERTFTVSRPIEVVFAYLGDFTHTEAWDPGTVSTTRVAGDGGLGTTYRNESQVLGRRVGLDYETVVFEEPHRLRFRGRNGTASGTDSMSFTATGDASTEIHYRADFDFGRFLNLVAPILVRRKVATLADETVERIQQAVAAL